MLRFLRVSLIAGALIAVLALEGIGSAAAQDPASLHGYVRDASTGETLLQANVVIEGTSRGAATNNAGYYTLRDLSPGTYTIVVSYLGYQTHREEVTLEAGEHRRHDVELVPVGLETEEVLVTGEAEEREDRSLGTDRLQTAAIEQLPSVLEPDVFRSLSLLPGVTTASDFSSNLYIRGGGPEQTLIQLDRTTVYNPTHFFGFFSTFNPDAIKDVQLYKGAYPAEYGGRLGSVIDIYNKDGNRREAAGGLHLGLLASRAYVEGPYETDEDDEAEGSYMIALRRSTLEPLLAALGDVEGMPETFAFYDLNAKVNYDAGPGDKLSLAVYGGQDHLDLQVNRDAQFEVGYGNRTLTGTWTHLVSDQVFSTLTVTGSRYESTPVAEVVGTRFTQRNEVNDLSLQADFEYVPGEHHTLKGGLEASTLTFALRNTFDGSELFRRHIRGHRAALYLRETYAPTPDWTLRGGMRGTYFSRGPFWRLSPRLSVEYDLTASVRLQAGVGRYHQFLTLETSELFTGFDTWLMADDGVPPSYGDQGAIGVTARIGDAWHLEVEGYGRTMHALFEQDPFLPDEAGIPYAERFHFGEGRAYGAELLVRRQGGPLGGFLSYTLGRTERRFPNINRSEAGEPQYYVPKFDRTHDLTLALNYEVTDGWRLTGTFNYATGQAYTEPAQRYSLVRGPFQSESEGRTVFISPFNNERLPPYHRLDLGVARTGDLFGGADYELQVQVINAYSRRNVWFYQFRSGDEGTVNRTEVPQIPIPLPNLSFSLSF